MEVRIYKPVKNAMQSGKKNTRQWVLECEPKNSRYIDPIMGWTGSSDTSSQLRLTFLSEEDAVAYAERYGLSYVVIPPHKPKPKIQSYAENFQ